MAINVDNLYTDSIALREFRGFDFKKNEFWESDYLTPYFTKNGVIKGRRLLHTNLMQSNAWDLEFWKHDIWEDSNFWKSPEWGNSDAKKIFDIARKVAEKAAEDPTKYHNFYTFPPINSPEEKFRKAAIALVAKASILRTPDETTHQRENYKLAVTLRSNQEKIIGYIALDEINWARGEYPDIGFFMDPDYRESGYTTEASQLVLNAFFRTTNHKKIFITYHPGNGASKKVAQKLGYRQIPGDFFLMVNNTREVRDKCELVEKEFYDKLPINFPLTRC